jgi:hypothetical protein
VNSSNFLQHFGCAWFDLLRGAAIDSLQRGFLVPMCGTAGLAGMESEDSGWVTSSKGEWMAWAFGVNLLRCGVGRLCSSSYSTWS